MTHIEVRSTIHQPGLHAGEIVIVDPELPYMKICLDAGYLVPTGRTFSIPSPVARGAVRPLASAPAEAVPETKSRKSRAKKSTPAS